MLNIEAAKNLVISFEPSKEGTEVVFKILRKKVFLGLWREIYSAKIKKTKTTPIGVVIKQGLLEAQVFLQQEIPATRWNWERVQHTHNTYIGVVKRIATEPHPAHGTRCETLEFTHGKKVFGKGLMQALQAAQAGVGAKVLLYFSQEDVEEIKVKKWVATKLD